MFGSSKGGGDNGASAARQAEQQRQNNISSGMSNIDGIFGQFNDDFYNKQKQNYLDYATPQLNDQYADARKALTYSLDRNGNLDSTARNSQEASLAKLYGTNKLNVDNSALDYVNTARGNVNSAKNTLIGNLQASGDAGAATDAATASATALSQPQAYSPLTQLFSTFTNGLATQAQLESAGAFLPQGQKLGAYNTGLFGSNNSVKMY